MIRRWALGGAVSILIGSLLLIAYAIRPPIASPATIQGWWSRVPATGETLDTLGAPNPNNLPALLYFSSDGRFSVEDSTFVYSPLRRRLVPVDYPGTYTFVSAQHIQLTIGTITATYEVVVEAGHTHNGLDGRLILRNQGMTYTYYRTHIPLEI